MDLTNEFRVGVPVDDAWKVLTDLERIAPCMPGAQLQEIAGDEYRGIVKVKVGPITAQYKGAATMVERDDAAHRAVLRAEGREMRGHGNAAATITALLTPDGDGTRVNVTTDLNITGKAAQFGGRGVLADISAKLMTQFADALERDVLSGAPTPAPPVEKKAAPRKTAAKKPAAAKKAVVAQATAAAERAAAEPGAHAKPAAPEPAAAAKPAEEVALAPAPAVRTVHQPEPQPVDLLDTAAAPFAKRLAPVIAAILVLLILRRLLRGGDGDD